MRRQAGLLRGARTPESFRRARDQRHDEGDERQDADERPRQHLRAPAAAQPQRGPHAVLEDGEPSAVPPLARTRVALVADVEDGAGVRGSSLGADPCVRRSGLRRRP